MALKSLHRYQKSRETFELGQESYLLWFLSSELLKGLNLLSREGKEDSKSRNEFVQKIKSIEQVLLRFASASRVLTTLTLNLVPH
jgi:hypothetical protein